jgi:hypothetical protein
MRSQLDSTYALGGSHDAPLGEFLARPVQILNETWTVGSNFLTKVDPWHLFLTDTKVASRIEGFRHIRGHLRVRAVVTGNPFLFGRMILAYEPLANRSVHDYGNAGTNTLRVCLSQMPHIYLDAATSEGGEMTLPFFTPYNWIDTCRAFAFSDMGSFYLANMTPLLHANDASSGTCTVTLFAWMEDVEICTPTSVDIGQLVYQNGLESKDEYHSGIISKPASAIAKGAGWLSHVPKLAPYALATEVAASTIGKVAHYFGFSRPSVLDNPSPYVPLRAGELATTNTHEVVQKLSVDARCGLTVDSRTVGLDGTDEMAIPSIVARESFINFGEWLESDAQGHQIASIAVSPYYIATATQTTPNRSAMPPMTAVGHMFDYWKGSIIYRFSIVSSQLHRGKLLVQYDPAGGVSGGTNEIYSKIIDISETRDFEFPVEWHSSYPYLRRYDNGISSFINNGWTTASGLNFDPESHNGRLTISVLTPLTSPDPTLGHSVKVMFFARGGSDLEFAVPRSSNVPFSYRSSNALVEPQNALSDAVDQPVDPVGGVPLTSIGDVHTPVSDKSSLVFFGESINSIRTLLRRYTRLNYGNQTVPTITGGSLTLPARAEIVPDGMPIREFIMNWYAGWRGGIRYKFILFDQNWATFMCSNHDRNFIGTVDMRSAHAGNIGHVEGELPFYSNARFSHTRTSPTWTADTDSNSYDPNRSSVELYSGGSLSRDGAGFEAVAEDFSCFFFVCIPPVCVT